jgi:hypothetical protein
LLAGLSAVPILAQNADPARLEKLEQENQDLRKRLEALEHLAQKEGIMASGETSKASPVKALSDITLSGFVTASYFYDTSEPPGNNPPGYLWNRTINSFTLNKVKLTLASKPVEASGDKWDAGYRVSLIFGQDAPLVNTDSGIVGFENIREAYVELNVPIGTGLNVKVGELISLLNFESGDGGAVNPNFSQGYQWFFTGNPPSAGAQAGYQFTEWFGAKVRIQNGLYAGPVDNNGTPSFMGSLDFKPDKKTSISLLGFGGHEDFAGAQWIRGGSLLASRQLMEKYNLTIATEIDYFNADLGATDTDWWSVGGWLWADFTPVFGAAVRTEFLSDRDGFATSGALGFPVNTGQDIFSVAFTLNYRPLPNVKIQPEVRFDHTSLNNGFGTQDDRVVLGAGVSYLF